jgi:hypothetical protein
MASLCDGITATGEDRESHHETESLHQEHGIDNASATDVYLSLLDPNDYPLTTFRNELSVADYNLVIHSPYHCVVDSYQP